MSSINFFLETETKQKSIIEVATMVISSLQNMSASDEVFRTAFFLDKKESHEFSTQDNDSAITLANHILEYSRGDILKFDGVNSPDLDYSRPYGFTFGLLFMDSGKKLLSLTFKLGSNNKNTIGTISIAKDLNRNFSWYKNLIDSFVGTGEVLSASARPSDIHYLEKAIKYSFGLGLITYFSNDYEIPIPDDLQEIEYEHTDNGKYLILSREDITTDPEKYEAGKQKLLEVMEEIKRRVPEYGK